MIAKRILVLVGIALAIAAVMAFGGGKHGGQLTPPPPVSTDVSKHETAALSHRPAVSNRRPTSRTWPDASALENRTFQDAHAELLSRFGPDDPVVASYALDWLHECRGNSSMLREAPEGVASARILLSTFCGNTKTLSDNEEVLLYRQTVRVALGSRLAQIEKAHGVDASIDFAQQFVREAKDPYSIKAGLDHLYGADVLAPDPVEVGVIDPQRLRQVFEMARDAYNCDMFGGCSASSPMAARFCIEMGCVRLYDYRGMVRDQLSPTDLNAFRWYLSAIRSIRR